MQCDLCESKATIFFTQIIDGVTKKLNLCETCAAEQGVTDPEEFLLDSLDMPLDETTPVEITQDIQPASVTASDESACCTDCGFSFDDLKKIGRLGCSTCYTFFREEIKHNLAGMHKGSNHVGRVPEGMLEAFQKRQQLEALETEMAQAIEVEDYEKASALRDEINQLEDADPKTP